MSALAENKVNQKLKPQESEIKPRLNFMFAYRQFYSFPTVLLTLTGHWKKELDKHHAKGAVVIDLH